MDPSSNCFKELHSTLTMSLLGGQIRAALPAAGLPARLIPVAA